MPNRGLHSTSLVPHQVQPVKDSDAPASPAEALGRLRGLLSAKAPEAGVKINYIGPECRHIARLLLLETRQVLRKVAYKLL
jgi:hypothetical protein